MRVLEDEERWTVAEVGLPSVVGPVEGPTEKKHIWKR